MKYPLGLVGSAERTTPRATLSWHCKSVQRALFQLVVAAIAVAVLAAGCGRGGDGEQGDELGLGDLVDQYLEVRWGQVNNAHRFDPVAYPPPPDIQSLLNRPFEVEADGEEYWEAWEAGAARSMFESDVIVHLVFASAAAPDSPSEDRLMSAYRNERAECVMASEVPDSDGKSAYEFHIAKREAGITDEDIAIVVDECHRQAMQFPALGEEFEELWEQQRQFYLGFARDWVEANPERVVKRPDSG